jgi:hypothetical protein
LAKGFGGAASGVLQTCRGRAAPGERLSGSCRDGVGFASLHDFRTEGWGRVRGSALNTEQKNQIYRVNRLDLGGKVGEFS